MSLEPRADDGVPEMTARMVRAAFPKGTLAVRIREAPGPLFADGDFAAAFPRRGRPAASPGALALVPVLQFAEGLSDRQAADQVRARMDWKFLLGLELDDPGFDFTVLGDFRTHLTETCEPDLPHLITNVETTGATVDGAEMTATIHQRLAGRGLTPAEHVADAGYVSAGHILTARDDHGITLLGPVGAGTTQAGRGDGREPLLAQAAFSVDWDARKVTCPQGAASISWSGQRKPSGTPIARVHFALAGCGPCPLRPQCTKAAHGRWGRSLTLLSRDQHEILARQRAEQQTPEWKARCNIRAGVEGTISQAVRATRPRRTPYRGQDKTHLASVLPATAINLIRAGAWLNGTPLGTTRVSHLARLASQRDP